MLVDPEEGGVSVWILGPGEGGLFEDLDQKVRLQAVVQMPGDLLELEGVRLPAEGDEERVEDIGVSSRRSGGGGGGLARARVRGSLCRSLCM